MRWIVPLVLAVAPAQSALAESADRLSYVLFDRNGSDSMSGSSDDFRRTNYGDSALNCAQSAARHACSLSQCWRIGFPLAS